MTSVSAFTPHRLARLDKAMRGHVDAGSTGGLAWLVAPGDEVHAGSAGRLGAGRGELRPDAIFTPDRT